MLIRFVISNFLSFGKECEFNMLPAPLKNHQNHLYYNATKRLKILKGATIYGANGAGKSNLIKAIAFLQKMVISGRILSNFSNYNFKLDEEIRKNPAIFDAEYEWNNKFYGYHIEIQNGIIIEESLYELGIHNEDHMLFERKLNKNIQRIDVKLSKRSNTNKKTELLESLLGKNILNNETLLLTYHPMLDNTKISNAFKWFEEGLLILFPHSKFMGMAKSLSDSEQFSRFANTIITALDTGVSEISINEISFDNFFGKDLSLRKQYESALQHQGKDLPVFLKNGNFAVASINKTDTFVIKKPITYHKDSKNNKISFDIIEESDGTQRLFDIIPAINLYLNNGTSIIIDEVDESLHPSLLKAIMSKIMESESSTRGQFIVTTHESNLLDYEIFRQDEIWFVEKHNGATEIYPLTDFKPRSDLQIQKGYLMGRFGAIPFLANLKDLKWQ